MEGQLDERKEQYTTAKALLDAAIRERNDKAWNRAAAELADATWELEMATANTAHYKVTLD